MNEVLIRSAVLSDCSCIYEIIIDNIKEVNSKYYSELFINTILQDLSIEKINEYFNENDRKLFVATKEFKVIGTASLCGDQVRMVFVNRNEQRKGIGERLMQRIEEVAKACGVIQLHLSSSLNAVSFYERLGYEKTIVEFPRDSFIEMTKRLNKQESFQD